MNLPLLSREKADHLMHLFTDQSKIRCRFCFCACAPAALRNLEELVCGVKVEKPVRSMCLTYTRY